LATTNTNHVTKAEMEKYLSKILEIRLRQAIEEYAARNEMHLKELSLLERIVRVEERLKCLREISEIKFEELKKEMKAGFEAMDRRFESLQREMNARFEAMDKRFSVIQWMIGILVGIPAIAITLIQVIGALK